MEKASHNTRKDCLQTYAVQKSDYLFFGGGEGGVEVSPRTACCCQK